MSSIEPLSPATSTRELLRVAPVRNFLGSSLSISSAVLLQVTILGKQIYDITGRELDIGLLGLAEFLPAVLLVLVTGSVADRFDRRIIAAVTTALDMLCVIALGVLSIFDSTSVWPLFLIAFVFGSARAFSGPATRSLPPMVAPRGALPRTIALYGATWTSAAIVGPALGGLLYSIEPALAYFLAAGLFAVGIVQLLAIRFENPGDEGREAGSEGSPERPTISEKISLHSALEGLRFIRRTPILLAAISLDLFAVLFGGAVALLPVIAEERLGVGDIGYGWLRAAPGIGAAIMALVLASRPVTRRVGPKLFTVVAIFGVATVVLGVTTSYIVAFISLVVLAASDMISVFIRSTLVPLVTPDDKRGRVLAVESVFIGASNELGAFESGVAAQAFGTQTAVIGGGVATIGIVAVYSIFFPSLRQVNRFEELDPSAAVRRMESSGTTG